MKPKIFEGSDYIDARNNFLGISLVAGIISAFVLERIYSLGAWVWLAAFVVIAMIVFRVLMRSIEKDQRSTQD